MTDKSYLKVSWSRPLDDFYQREHRSVVDNTWHFLYTGCPNCPSSGCDHGHVTSVYLRDATLVWVLVVIVCLHVCHMPRVTDRHMTCWYCIEEASWIDYFDYFDYYYLIILHTGFPLPMYAVF